MLFRLNTPQNDLPILMPCWIEWHMTTLQKGELALSASPMHASKQFYYTVNHDGGRIFHDVEWKEWIDCRNLQFSDNALK